MRKGMWQRVPKIIVGATGWSGAPRGGIHGSRYQGVEVGVAPLVITPRDYWETLAPQPIISRLHGVWHPGSQEGILSPEDMTRVLLSCKLRLWSRLGTPGPLWQRPAGKMSRRPIRNPWLWWAGGGGAAVAWQVRGVRCVELRWYTMAALDTPLAGCDCDGQAQQPKPEQHMVTRDSDSSGIRVWEEPQGKPLRPAGVIEWMVHEGDDGFRSWAWNQLQGP